jgi:hypothetical protein
MKGGRWLAQSSSLGRLELGLGRLPRLFEQGPGSDSLRNASMRFTFYSRRDERLEVRKVNSSQDRCLKRLKFLEKGAQQALLKKVFHRRRPCSPSARA